MPRIGQWPVYIVVVAIFIPHGFSKFSMLGGSMVEMMVLVLVALGEIVSDLLMLVGGLLIPRSELATRAAAVVMLGVIFTAHWARWPFGPAEGFLMGGMQFQVLLIAVSVGLFTLGSSAAKQNAEVS